MFILSAYWYRSGQVAISLQPHLTSPVSRAKEFALAPAPVYTLEVDFSNTKPIHDPLTSDKTIIIRASLPPALACLCTYSCSNLSHQHPITMVQMTAEDPATASIPTLSNNMAESALVPLPVHSTATLELSRVVQEEPTVPFDFASLPPEIRNKVYRYILVQETQPVSPVRTWSSPALEGLAILSTNRLIYSEAMPILLSENTFKMTGSRREHTWLRRMRPEGRSEVRSMSLNVPPAASLHDASFYNALSLCSRLQLTVNVRPSRLVEVSLENKGNLRYMHGFAAATSDALPKETEVCAMHQRHLITLPAIRAKTWDRMQSYELLLQQFRAPCVGKCRVHKGREGTNTQATIHVSFQETCFYCC